MSDTRHGPARVESYHHFMRAGDFIFVAGRARLDCPGDHRPPHSGVFVAGLGSAEALIEVEVIAWQPPAG